MLAAAGPRRPPKPLMTYGIVCIMATGAVGELVNAVRSSSQLDYGGSLVPVLAFAGAVVGALMVYARAAGRRSTRLLATMPAGEQQLVVSEGGWRIAPAESMDGPVRSWEELRHQRTGSKSMILLGTGGAFAALPLRVLNASQGGYLHRLLVRKLHRVM